MLKYAVVEILGKQYLVEPGKEVMVGNLGEIKNLNCDKVLILSNEKLQIGKPYLKETLKFEVLGNVNKKIRVSTFHAKANYRRVVGAKNSFSKIKMPVKKP